MIHSSVIFIFLIILLFGIGPQFNNRINELLIYLLENSWNKRKRFERDVHILWVRDECFCRWHTQNDDQCINLVFYIEMIAWQNLNTTIYCTRNSERNGFSLTDLLALRLSLELEYDNICIYGKNCHLNALWVSFENGVRSENSSERDTDSKWQFDYLLNNFVHYNYIIEFLIRRKNEF